MEHHFKILEWFEEKWPGYPKDIVFPGRVGNAHGYLIAFEVSPYRVLFGAMQGSRGGITGILVVVNPTQPVEIDRLLCSDATIRREEPISHLDLLVHYNKQDFNEVCPEYLIDTMREWKDAPGLVATMADIVGFGQPSVLTLAGGAVSPR